MDFETWVAKELAYLESVASEPACDALTVDYVEALEKLNTYQKFHLISFAHILKFIINPDNSSTPLELIDF
jgi:hypothetical protein